jgi:hypothetical protein
MSGIKLPSTMGYVPRSAFRDLDLTRHLDPEVQQLLELASQLGPRDRIALSHIIRRTVEICETDGEEVALAVIEQIQGILEGRLADA